MKLLNCNYLPLIGKSVNWKCFFEIEINRYPPQRVYPIMMTDEQKSIRFFLWFNVCLMINQNEFGCKCNRNDFHALQRSNYKMNLRVLIEKYLFDEHLLSSQAITAAGFTRQFGLKSYNIIHVIQCLSIDSKNEL